MVGPPSSKGSLMLLVMSNFLKQNFSSARVVFILLQTHWNWEIHGMQGTCRGLKQQSQQQELGFHHQGIPNICKLANKQSRGFRPVMQDMTVTQRSHQESANMKSAAMRKPWRPFQ